MLFVPDADVTVVPDDYDVSSGLYRGRTLSIAHACGFDGPGSGLADTVFGRFDYLFPEAADFPVSGGMTACLDALAEAMARPTPKDARDSEIAPVFAFFGQFIDHDLAACADREAGLSTTDSVTVVPMPRADIAGKLANLRHAALNLDTVYGGGPIQGPIAARFDEALRYDRDRAMLWAGRLSKSHFDPVPFPKDPTDLARDLLRTDHFLRDDSKALTETFLRNLPVDLRRLFVNDDGTMRAQRAIIGDLRNDENLGLAQFHLAVVRLHNRIAINAPKYKDAPTDDRDKLFEWARKMTRWHYQWLVVNAYLPAICDADTLAGVAARGPVVYNRFLDRVGRHDHHLPLLPVPLEFSAAAFRFRPSMVRDRYDWSFQYGRPVDRGLSARADVNHLFAFTGNGHNPMGGAPRLPQHWPIDWSRFVNAPTPDKPDRSARPIGTCLGPYPGDMPNRMARLAARDLRLGYRLNLPSAQQCLDRLRAVDGIDIAPLSADALRSGPTGDAVAQGGFYTDTPLWFYVLKEAEELGTNGTLGPLGSLLVADTLLGLVVNDAKSYWQAASDPGAWHPRDGARPDGIVIDSMSAMMDAARLL